MVRQIGQKVVMKPSQTESSGTINTNEETEQTHLLILPYRGKQGDRALRNINREINYFAEISYFAENKKSQVICVATKLGSTFNINIKGITKKEHQHHLIYSVRCDKSYNDEIGRMLAKRVNNHSSIDPVNNQSRKTIQMWNLKILKFSIQDPDV